MLSGAKRGHNVVLISGRNGFGKTSFINCVKLLFHGASEDLRQTVQMGRSIKEMDYVLGTGNEWQGILNRRARQDGVSDYFVELGWTEAAGTVVVRRQWILESESKVSKELTITSSFAGLMDQNVEEAQAFLDERIPIDFAPFFFFDGEQVQQLAEANRQSQLEQIERLLGISRIERLRDYVNRITNEWRKQGMEADARHALAILEREIAEIAASATSLSRQQDLEQEGIDELDRQIQSNRRYLESMRAFGQQVNERRAQEEIGRLSEDLDRERAAFADSFPAQAFLLANPKLVEATIEKLRVSAGSNAPGQGGSLVELLKDLPRDLFEKGRRPEPPLLDSQKQFYKEKLLRWVSTYIESNNDTQYGLSLPNGAAESILRELFQVTEGTDRRSRFIEQVRGITARKRELFQAERKLNDVSSLSADEQELYQQRRRENDEREGKVAQKRAEKTELEKQHRDALVRQAEKERALAEQRQRVRLGQQLQHQVELASKVQHFLQDYKQELKSARRLAIEKQFNARFTQLFTSNRLVSSIRVGEDFDLHYLDKSGDEVGMANLSAGMKQIAAMALLWALGDVSGREVPLVIDTPLARIDHENQENIITKYYPKVAKQVIILPTDSELDRQKYKLLEPYIYRQYRLSNPEGDQTAVLESSMY